MTRTLVKFVLALTLCLTGIGFVRGWFVVTTPSSEQGHQVNINLKVDKDKVEQDAEAFKQKTTELANRAESKLRGDEAPTQQQ